MLMNRRLYRSAADRKIGGVAAGTAAYFDIDVSISRVIWLLLAIFTGGTFVVVYLVMWAIVPEEPWNPTVGAPAAVAASPDATDGAAVERSAVEGTAAEAAGDAPAPAGPAQATSSWAPTSQVQSGPGPHVIFGVILILIGGWFLAQQFLPWLNFGTLWPIGLVVIGVVVLLAALRRPA
jgi:phage shock protein PspC (stress-responsive transcriptional regulator)